MIKYLPEIIIALVPLLTAIFIGLENRKRANQLSDNIAKKADLSVMDGIVTSTEQVRTMYENSMNDLEERWRRKFETQEADCKKDIARLQELGDQQRERLAVQEERIANLKEQVTFYGGVVTGRTADIWKTNPRDPQSHTRKTDKDE